ncbi:serine carboxypeptidase [Dichomitus squalens]|uniref:Carboxypeptidase n=1 Tax=Dichomitus squalens TaxID=114155 RepID=A0A4Q9MKW2_9APHY|nr:serine carboxypeptidase [Dichomitus squalens]
MKSPVLGLLALLPLVLPVAHGTRAGAQGVGGQLRFEQQAFSRYDDGLFTPFGEPSALSSTAFTELGHPAFPRHSVRVKKSDFCDGTVQAYTGYIDVQARHLFFYFFESRRDPDADDVVFWTNGGPGGSSSLGLFMELGPCRVTSPNSTEFHPQSWNEYSNIFFIDQPVDVGFSYAEYGEAVSTTVEAADDVAAFVAIFFEHFTKFKGRALHLAGESYGGRYLPVFASAIYDQNAKLVEAGLTPVNLTSLMIGNGCTDFKSIMPSWYNAQCEDPTFPPTLSISECVRMKQLLPRCEKRYKESCEDVFDAIDCNAATEFCDRSLNGLLYNKVNPYDRSYPCNGLDMDTECYPIMNNIMEYLSDKTLQERLGVDPARRGPFKRHSTKVSSAFFATSDFWSFPAHYYLAALLERNIRVLIYVGQTDFICHWMGNEKMTLELEWTENEAFRRDPLRAWTVNGSVAGVTRTGGGLTFATIDGAGHFAPYDKPIESLELVNRWLAGKELQ